MRDPPLDCELMTGCRHCGLESDEVPGAMAALKTSMRHMRLHQTLHREYSALHGADVTCPCRNRFTGSNKEDCRMAGSNQQGGQFEVCVVNSTWLVGQPEQANVRRDRWPSHSMQFYSVLARYVRYLEVTSAESARHTHAPINANACLHRVALLLVRSWELSTLQAAVTPQLRLAVVMQPVQVQDQRGSASSMVHLAHVALDAGLTWNGSSFNQRLNITLRHCLIHSKRLIDGVAGASRCITNGELEPWFFSFRKRR